MTSGIGLVDEALHLADHCLRIPEPHQVVVPRQQHEPGPSDAVGQVPAGGGAHDAVILDWNAGTHQVIKAADGYLNPMAASRSLAMVHLAMHDAANAVDARYESYALKGAPSSFAQHSTRRRADEGVAAIAAATAAHDVLAALYPQQKPLLQSTLGHGFA
jgi:hypothetical protein